MGVSVERVKQRDMETDAEEEHAFGIYANPNFETMDIGSLCFGKKVSQADILCIVSWHKPL